MKHREELFTFLFFPLVYRSCLALTFPAVVKTEFCSAVRETLWKCSAPRRETCVLGKKDLILN